MYTVEIDDEIELNVLHMLIIEAKFSKNIERAELRGSPYVCKLAKKVLTELTKVHPDFSKYIETYPDLFDKIPNMIKEIDPDIWNDWDKKERKKYLEALICPFESNSNFIDKYINTALSYDINDYPEIFSMKLKGIKYEIEVNDIEFWKEMTIKEKKEEIKSIMEPYKISDIQVDSVLSHLTRKNES